MENRKKKRIWVLAICLCLGIFLLLNVGIAGGWETDHSALCISFDKWDMMTADKVVVWNSGNQYTVTDPEFVRQLTRETTVAAYNEQYCCASETGGWIEIYKGDRLVRRMRWATGHSMVAYEADLLHWVFFGKEGHASLSNELIEKLNELTGKNYTG